MALSLLNKTKPFYRWSRQEFLAYFRKLDRKAKQKLLVFSGAGLFLILFVVWPAWFERPRIRAQVLDLDRQIQSAQSEIAGEPKLLEEKKKYQGLVEEVRSRIFMEGEQPQGLLGMLSEMAEKSQVVFVSGQPQTGEVKIPAAFEKKYRPLSYEIAVEGGYHALANLVNEIENYPRILRVEEVSITPHEETPGTHLGELKISVFFLNKQALER